MKDKIRDFVLGLGVDDVGIAAAKDYKSPRSPDLQGIFPGAKSLVVLAYQELSNCESENMQIATGGTPATFERRAYTWQYSHWIRLSPAWILWLNLMGWLPAGMRARSSSVRSWAEAVPGNSNQAAPQASTAPHNSRAMRMPARAGTNWPARAGRRASIRVVIELSSPRGL